MQTPDVSTGPSLSSFTYDGIGKKFKEELVGVKARYKEGHLKLRFFLKTHLVVCDCIL